MHHAAHQLFHQFVYGMNERSAETYTWLALSLRLLSLRSCYCYPHVLARSRSVSWKSEGATRPCWDPSKSFFLTAATASHSIINSHQMQFSTNKFAQKYSNLFTVASLMMHLSKKTNNHVNISLPNSRSAHSTTKKNFTEESSISRP